MNLVKNNFDVIIIGSGGAGLMSALSCINNGIKNIAVISKVFPILSHTVAAKGGINAALGNKEKDNWKWHSYDTIKAGNFLADKDVVDYMCENAPKAIIELERIGVAFSRFANGKIYQRAYGGQKTDFGKGKIAFRACCSKDRTGHTILNSLYQQCLKKGVKFFNEFFVTDLLMADKNQCCGAIAIDLNQGQINIFNAKITIIATGGYSQIYKNATSSTICTGDGNATILKAGLPLQDMEFVQFHPTSLYQSNLLITEAARGEGGYLVNNKGEKFMEKYSPDFGDLASRDVIARAMATEIYEGRGCGKKKDHLHLIISHLGEKTIRQKLPAVIELANSFAKIDAIKEPIPVTPVAHYTMGGIAADINCKVPKTKGLLAIGEAACMSVHGANRLGCNSLLDIIVFGKKSGEVAAKELKNHQFLDNKDLEKIAAVKAQKITDILNRKGEENSKNISEIKEELQETTWKFAGIFRNKELLEKGLKKLNQLYQSLKITKIKNKSLFFNDELIEYLENENLLLQAIATLNCALLREESRGSHFREDFQKTNDDKWLCHSLFSFKNIDDLSFDFRTEKVRKEENNKVL